VKPLSQRPRLADVARLAEVSLGSASRALSIPHAVKPLTLRRVRAAAEKLGYLPDGTARALAMGRSQTVGVVLPTVNNPVYSDFVHALQKQLAAGGYYLLISAHEYDRDQERAQVERLQQRGVDGLILVGTGQDVALLARLERAGNPYLFTWSLDEAEGRPSVGFSNRHAIQPVVRHLLDLGHRRFAVLSGDPTHNERARGRITGIRETLTAAGIELPVDRIVTAPFTIDAARKAFRLAMTLSPRPTALVCTADLLAAGALAEARDAGIAVPKLLSITGMDNIEFAALLNPPLTTIHVPTDEIGRRAADSMLAALKHGAPIASWEVETQLVVRASTAPPPKTRREK
jgi:LacI family transcriptional regulator